MRFLYLTEMGHHYSTEEGNPNNVRSNLAVWQGIENKLKKAIVDLKALEQPAQVGAYASVTAKQAFFKQAADTAGNDAKKRELRSEIDRLRRWLKSEGVTAQPDGTILATSIQPLVVKYDRDLTKQGSTMVRFSGGKLYTDNAFRSPLDTTKMVTHFSGPGKAIFVMSQSGNIHVDSHVVGNRHHSSLLAGGNVACAGEIEVVMGAVKWLSNKSGHYAPNPDHLLQILHILQKRNVPMAFKLTVMSASGRKDYASVAEFMQQRLLDEEPDYDFGKLLRYSNHLDNAILARNNWRWRFPNEDPGVYDLNTNTKVAHKVVRQWLKSNGMTGDLDTQSGSSR